MNQLESTHQLKPCHKLGLKTMLIREKEIFK